MKLVKFEKNINVIGFELIGSGNTSNYYLAANTYGTSKKRQYEKRNIIYQGTKKECKEYFENQIIKEV